MTPGGGVTGRPLVKLDASVAPNPPTPQVRDIAFDHALTAPERTGYKRKADMIPDLYAVRKASNNDSIVSGRADPTASQPVTRQKAPKRQHRCGNTIHGSNLLAGV
jgi:hypothetical protein